MTRGVVITGIGWVTPLGHDIETVWSHLLAGRTGIGQTRNFDASTFPTQFSAQVKDYDYRRYTDKPQLHEGVGLNTAFALGAAVQAWRSAKLNVFDELDHERLGMYLGSGEGSLDFDNYVAANLGGWDPVERRVDAVRWADVAKVRMSAVREIEQEPNMPLTHLAYGV